MALALGLVGQPVQPYLTTGSSDAVNSILEGKESALKLKGLDSQNKKNALDLIAAQNKSNEDQWVHANAPTALEASKNMTLSNENMARMIQAAPEFAKVLQTNQADAVKNFYALNALHLNGSTDKQATLNDLAHAHEAHGVPLPDEVKNNPDLAMQYYKTLINGAKAFDEKTINTDDQGNVTETNLLGEKVGYKPNANKAKPVPTGKTEDVPLGKDGSYVRYALNTDGSRTEVGTYRPPAPKSPSETWHEETDPITGLRILKSSTGDRKEIDKSASNLVQLRVNSILTPISEVQNQIAAIEELPIGSRISAMNDAISKGGTSLQALRNFAARNLTPEDSEAYKKMYSGIAAEIARAKTGGYGTNQAFVNAVERSTAALSGQDTNYTAMLGFLNVVNGARAAIRVMKMGSKEQRDEAKALDDYFKKFPTQAEYIRAVKGKQNARFGDEISPYMKKDSIPNPPQQTTPSTQQPAKQPQTTREWYLYRFEQAKNNPALQKKLTDQYIQMGSPK